MPVLPQAAEAGYFSIVRNLIDSTASETSAAEARYNSQNIPLLQPALNLDPNPSKGGGDITVVDGKALVPELGPSGSLVDIAERPESSQISVYVVRKGDTLGEIAAMFNVSVNTIVWANDIVRGVIREGQTLVILPVTGIRHTVAKGDTLQSIAKKYKADLEEISQYNDIALGTTLSLGEVIIIPDGEIAPPPASSRTSPLRGASSVDLAGAFIWPVDGGRKTQGLHGYNGIDIGAPVGTPIYAAASGAVIVARGSGWNGGYGVYIVINHANGVQTLYSHLSHLAVSPGSSVSRGQVIGYVGATGRATGPHLHFEVRGAKNPF